LAVWVTCADNNRNVKGATVKIKGPANKSGTTDDDGVAMFKPVKPGSYDINTTLPNQLANNYSEPEPETENVSAGWCVVHPIKVYPLSTLKVRVLRMEGDKEKFLEGVKIHIKGRDEQDGQTPKTKDGRVIFDKIESGDYEIDITSMGTYQSAFEPPQTSGGKVEPGQTKEVQLYVHPNGWVEFQVIEAHTDAVKKIEAFEVTAKLPGDQTITRPARNGIVRYEKLMSGKAGVEKVNIKKDLWEFASIEVDKQE